MSAFLILEAETRHMWDDFDNATVVARDFRSKKAAREWLFEHASKFPTVQSFTIAQIYCGGIRLVSGPTKRTFLINATKEN